MPEFMVLIHENEADGATLTPSETRALLERQAAYEQKLRASKAYVEGERFRPSVEGRRVSKEGGAGIVPWKHGRSEPAGSIEPYEARVR